MKKSSFRSVVLATVGAVVLLSGCGSSRYSSDNVVSKEAAYEDAAYGVYDNAMMAGAPEEADMTESAGTDSAVQVKDSSKRKLVTTVNIAAETENFEATLGNIESKVKELGGYIESSDVYNNSNYSYSGARSASLKVRIPANKLDEFIDMVDGSNNIINKSVSVEDVTLTYVDMQSRKNSLKTEEKRLLEILESAETVEDIITIEDKLASVRYELESIESQLRSYDNMVDYSTVYLSVDEVKTYTPVEKESILTRIERGFKDNLENVKEGLEDFIVVFVSSLPQLFVLAIVVFIIVLIIKAIVKNTRKRRAKRMEKMQSAYMAQNVQNAQNMQNGQNVQNGQSMQNMQNGQNVQNIQSTQNGQNAQNEQNIRNLQSVHGTDQSQNSEPQSDATNSAGIETDKSDSGTDRGENGSDK